MKRKYNRPIKCLSIFSELKHRWLVFMLILISQNNIANAQIWHNVGSPGFSAGAAGKGSMAVDGSGTPYAAYIDFGYAMKMTVMKYNGTSWVNVGSPGFSIDTAQYPVIAIDGSGTPYVVYQDYANSQKATVMKYNGSSWVAVGSPGFTSPFAGNTTIAIDGSGTPYVAFQDAATSPSGKVSVMKFNGTSWVYVGSPGFSAWSSSTGLSRWIAIDGSGTPYVAYQDYSTTPVYKATVMKYNGSSWVPVGSVGFSDGAVSGVSIAIDGSGNPFVAYTDAYWASHATVMEFSGGIWFPVSGSPAFTVGTAGSVSIAMNGSGTPYISFADGGCSTCGTIYGAASVMKYNGSSWVNVGSPAFSAGGVSNTSIAIDGSGTPYVTYMDFAYSNKATTMKLVPAPSSITGSSTVCVGGVTTLSDITTGGTWSSSTTSIGTVGVSTGIVHGVSAGTTTISYTTLGGSATFVVTVMPLPSAGIVSGSSTVCSSATITLTDAITGGTWSSGATSIATVSSTGIVTGVSVGTATISYSVTNSCGTAVATKIVTVNPLPNAGSITGIATVCVSSTTTLSNIITGGVWSSGTTSIATVGSTGIVGGVFAGTTTISYSVTNSCGIAVATQIITVNPLPNAGSITGTTTICLSFTTTLSNTITGGSWSSGTTSVAAVGSTGIVDGVTAGTATISYSITNSCGTAVATQTVTVDVFPNSGIITGSDSVCVGDTISLTDPNSGGVWSVYNGNVSVSASGIVSGTTVGSDTIYYSITNICGTATAKKLINVSSCSTEVNKIPEKKTVSLFPNPSHNNITIISTEVIYSIVVDNLIGQVVFSDTYATNRVVINLEELPNGIYLVKLNGSKVYKLIKQ